MAKYKWIDFGPFKKSIRSKGIKLTDDKSIYQQYNKLIRMHGLLIEAKSYDVAQTLYNEISPTTLERKLMFKERADRARYTNLAEKQQRALTNALADVVDIAKEYLKVKGILKTNTKISIPKDATKSYYKFTFELAEHYESIGQNFPSSPDFDDLYEEVDEINENAWGIKLKDVLVRMAQKNPSIKRAINKILPAELDKMMSRALLKANEMYKLGEVADDDIIGEAINILEDAIMRGLAAIL